MAVKIKLGVRPKTFRRSVKFPMLDGTEGYIEIVYKYRTKKEFGAFIDAMMEEAKIKREPSDPGVNEPEFSMQALMEKTGSSNADYIMRVVDGWNLDEEFTLDNVAQLADEIPAAALAIMETYRIACTDGRLGN